MLARQHRIGNAVERSGAADLDRIGSVPAGATLSSIIAPRSRRSSRQNQAPIETNLGS